MVLVCWPPLRGLVLSPASELFRPRRVAPVAIRLVVRIAAAAERHPVPHLILVAVTPDDLDPAPDPEGAIHLGAGVDHPPDRRLEPRLHVGAVFIVGRDQAPAGAGAR